MTLTYILDSKTPVPEADPLAWQTWMSAAQGDGRRIVAQSQISRRVNISTVFVGLDQGPAGSPGFDRPALFESAVFEDGQIAQTRYYADWQEAEAGHAALVASLSKSQA